jgi:hypothetical protein
LEDKWEEIAKHGGHSDACKEIHRILAGIMNLCCGEVDFLDCFGLERGFLMRNILCI